jgi:hypothetical protein
MKIKNKFLFAVLFTSMMFLFTACNESTEDPQDNDTIALSGFIEIRDNVLFITPVEVFMLYSADSEHNFLQNTADPALRSIIFIESNDSEKLNEHGLNADDFTSWAYIRPNWHSEKNWHYVEQANTETHSYMITGETEFVFIDSERNLRNTNAAEAFLPYLYPTVVHFIEVNDGMLIRLVQEFGFTM